MADNTSHESLKPETEEFLSQLREEDIETLKEGLRLVNAVKTVGTFVKWVVILLFGIFIGFIMLWENTMKLIHLWAGK